VEESEIESGLVPRGEREKKLEVEEEDKEELCAEDEDNNNNEDADDRDGEIAEEVVFNKGKDGDDEIIEE
jgi:hypothetical protein